MTDYRIITDATCDMNLDILERFHIDVIPMEVTMDDERTFLHYPDFRNFAAEDFYNQLNEGNYSKSSQITPQQYLDFFSPILASGNDILYVCFSSGLSGSYQSALHAQAQLQEQFPERTLIIIDSLCACTGEGVLAVQAGINKEELGMSLEENAAWLEENKLHVTHFFTVGDLFLLHKGGRVNAASAVMGTVLNIKPILIVDEEGKLVVVNKVRGRKTALKKLLEMTRASIQNPENQVIYIAQANCMEDALWLKDLTEKEIPCKEVVITGIGPVVGTHTGETHMCMHCFGAGRQPV